MRTKSEREIRRGLRRFNRINAALLILSGGQGDGPFVSPPTLQEGQKDRPPAPEAIVSVIASDSEAIYTTFKKKIAALRSQ